MSRAGATVALLGALLSGPGAIAVVEATHPQPSWRGVEAFRQAYHPIQTLPYFCGFLLVGGFVLLLAGLHVMASQERKARSAAALAFVAAFSAMIFLNYTAQTTFVPALVRSDAPAAWALVEAFTMARPGSLGWALEMWGYAVLGVATWLCAPVFEARRLGRVTATLFVANGPVSVLGGLLTAANPMWVLQPIGLALFGLWNVLIVAMLATALVSLRATKNGT